MIQETLFEPSEEDLYQRAIKVPLDKKIDRAINLLKTLEPSAMQRSLDGFYACYSGGKDSEVIYGLLKKAGVKYTLNYNVATIDPPELVWHIKKKHPECIWHRGHKKPLPLKMKDKSNGPPTRKGRWCCEIYKEGGGEGHIKVTGVRAEESTRRKTLWRETNPSNAGATICPIIYWTDDDVWNFIRQENLDYCELYDQGFKRLGCIGCPLGGPKKQAMEFKRWPRYEKLWRKGFDIFGQNITVLRTEKVKIDGLKSLIVLMNCGSGGQVEVLMMETMTANFFCGDS